MITIISTTNRKGSLTEKVSEYYASILESKDINTQIIKLIDLPKDSIFSILYENNGKNEEFNKIKDKVVKSEKLIFIVPEYNSSMPGVLKVFLDGLGWPSELKNKKCALVGISDGVLGCTLGLSHLTDILHYFGAYILPLRLKLGDIKKANIKYLLDNKSYIKLIETQLNDFIKF